MGEVCTVVNGGTPRTDVSAYWDGRHQWITPAEMGRRTSPFVTSTARTLSNEGLANSSATLIPARSVILSTRAPIGHLVINEVPMAFNQGCRGLVPGPGLSSKFLFHFLDHSRGLLDSLGTGATFRELSGSRLREVLIPVPPVAEQERIVRILDEALDGIAAAQEHTEAVLAHAEALFQSTLNQAVEQATRGLPLVPLSSALESQPRNGWSPPASAHATVGVPVLTLSAVTGFEYNPTKVKYTSAETDSAAHYWLHPGDLLMTRSNTPRLVGHVAVYYGDPERVIYPDLIMRMRTNMKMLRTKYAYYALRTDASRAYLTSRAGGASQTMSKITKSVVQELPIAIPPIATQDEVISEIDSVQAASRELASAATRKLLQIAALREVLLQRAFAGQL